MIYKNEKNNSAVFNIITHFLIAKDNIKNRTHYYYDDKINPWKIVVVGTIISKGYKGVVQINGSTNYYFYAIVKIKEFLYYNRDFEILAKFRNKFPLCTVNTVKYKNGMHGDGGNPQLLQFAGKKTNNKRYIFFVTLPTKKHSYRYRSYKIIPNIIVKEFGNYGTQIIYAVPISEKKKVIKAIKRYKEKRQKNKTK